MIKISWEAGSWIAAASIVMAALLGRVTSSLMHIGKQAVRSNTEGLGKPSKNGYNFS